MLLRSERCRGPTETAGEPDFGKRREHVCGLVEPTPGGLASRRSSVLTQPGLQVFAVNDPKHEQDTLGIEQVVRDPVVPDPQAAEGICGALNSKYRSERHRARTDQRVRGRRPLRLHPDPSGNRADRRLVRHNEKLRARGKISPLRLLQLHPSPKPDAGRRRRHRCQCHSHRPGGPNSGRHRGPQQSRV